MNLVQTRKKKKHKTKQNPSKIHYLKVVVKRQIILEMSLMLSDECTELGENVIAKSKRWRANNLLTIASGTDTRSDWLWIIIVF